jgi:hypothetical protein
MKTQFVMFLYSLAWMGITAAITFFVWKGTMRYCEKEWLRFAPQKAKDKVIEAQKVAAAATRRVYYLETEIAELRGRIEGARLRLEKTRSLELVERRGA